MTEQDKLFQERLDKFEEKYDNEIKSINEKQLEIIKRLAELGPILKQLCENVKKISSNFVDKKRIEDLEEELDKERQKFETYKKETDTKLSKLENAEANKALAEKNAIKNKILMWVIGVLLAGIGMFVGIIWGVVTANTQNIIDHNINNPNIQSEVVDNGN